VSDKEEKPYSVRYEQVNAMLLNAPQNTGARGNDCAAAEAN
jgi:hypothetical protein